MGRTAEQTVRPGMRRGVSFRYATPDPRLAGLVAFHYAVEVGDEGVAAPVCALLGQIQLTLAGSAAYALAGGVRVLPPVAVVAPTDRAAQFRATPGHAAVGCGLTPAGWARLIGIPAGTTASAVLPAAAVFGAAAEALIAPGPIADAVAALDAALVARLAEALPIDPRVAAIDAWIVGGAPGGPEALAAALGVSRRGLERLTKATHGATPKLIAAKYRTLMAAARMAIGFDWRDPQIIGEFADQPHFIREFKRFVGMTPRAFLAAPDSLGFQLIHGQWHPGREIGIAIWM